MARLGVEPAEQPVERLQARVGDAILLADAESTAEVRPPAGDGEDAEDAPPRDADGQVDSMLGRLRLELKSQKLEIAQAENESSPFSDTVSLGTSRERR